MRRIMAVWLTIVLTVLLGNTGAFAEKPDVSGSASVGVFSNYVWRGQKLSNAYVIQPSVGITYNGFGVSLWSNIDSDFGDEMEITETDLTIDYAFDIDKFSLDTGLIYYGLEGAADTAEIYASVSYDTLLSPSLTLYYDIDEGDGGFLVFSIGHSFSLPKDISLSLGASASVNLDNEVMGYDSGGDTFTNFYNGELSASLSIPVTGSITLEPMIAYSFPLSNDAEDAIMGISDDGDRDIFYGGITLSLSF
ncbi:MAG: hypothetical protein D6726_11735 [Nitrospirae bacterium]|nr:MAG: hypothetical protein D6726_11735 [Nitrospirota bacterium]